MRIVHVITTLDVGGAEKHLLWLTGGQRARGHEVSVVFLKGGGALAGDFEAQGVATAREPIGLGVVGRLARRLRALAPDVVHTHLLKADAVGALAARRAGVPTVVSSKHNDERALLRAPVSLAHGWIARRVDRTIALSDHVAGFVARHGRVPRERVCRVYYGVDPARLQPARDRAAVRAELGLADEVPVLVCVARLAPQKDHETLFRAVAACAREVVLLVVGGDPFGDGEARLRARAGALGVADRVRFLGIRDDVPDLLSASELFTLASLWEGLGLVFLEAMAVSLPIVATRVSAVPEVVGDDEAGWLVPAGDPAALAAAIDAALADPEARRARDAAGRVRLERIFGLPRMIDETLAVYAEARR